MPSLRSHAIVDHSPEDVWAVVRDVANVSGWFPAMSSSTATATATGRIVMLNDGRQIEEDTVTLDDALRRYQYRVRAADMPVDSHLGTVDVLGLPGGRTLIVYGTDIEPAETAEAFDVAISAAVAGLNDRLRKQCP